MNLLQNSALIAAGVSTLTACTAETATAKLAGTKPNILLITADDLNFDSLGIYGSKTPDISPNLDRLAKSGVRFQNAHVAIAVCQPCRSTIMTGCYPHKSSGEGFNHINFRKDISVLPDLMRAAGYTTGILGKGGHSTPKTADCWDYYLDWVELGMGRNKELYYQNCMKFIKNAKAAEKPFFFMVNSHDPHRPFYGNDPEKWYAKTDYPALKPSRIYLPQEVEVPKFLEDLPDVRKEVAEYYSSVKRLDDTVGRVLDSLRDNNMLDNTVIFFMSDHGMALPYAKTNCYFNSTKTPLMISWPGKIKPEQVEDDHFVSTIDYMPTFLELAGAKSPNYIDGRSIVPILEGKQQPERDHVYTSFNSTSAKKSFTMRAVLNKKYVYIFNPWSDGSRVFKNESQFGRTFKAMREAGKTDQAVQHRVTFFSKRTVEEFYDLQKDPQCRNNLIDNPEFKEEIKSFRKLMKEEMTKSGDRAAAVIDYYDNPEKLKAFMDEELKICKEIGKKDKQSRPAKKKH